MAESFLLGNIGGPFGRRGTGTAGFLCPTDGPRVAPEPRNMIGIGKGEPPRDTKDLPPEPTVTAKQLGKVLKELSFEDEQLAAVKTLGPLIADKAGAARMIAKYMAYSDGREKALAYLSGRPLSEEAPSLNDRLEGLVDGAALPLHHYVPVAIIAALGTIAFELLGIHLGQVPALDWLAQVSGSSGYVADFLAAMLGTGAVAAIGGAVRGFVDPARAGLDSAATGANVGSGES
jgi:hypothetical protein